MLDWPWMRWFVSRAATMLVTPLVSVKDPLSGFFAVRRELLRELASDTAGYMLHPIDLAVNKLLALVGRDEPRDFLDTLYVHHTVLALGLLRVGLQRPV